MYREDLEYMKDGKWYQVELYDDSQPQPSWCGFSCANESFQNEKVSCQNHIGFFCTGYDLGVEGWRALQKKLMDDNISGADKLYCHVCKPERYRSAHNGIKETTKHKWEA